MKRRLLLLFLIALLLTLSVHAAGTVRLEELGMSVYVPEGYTVITRNMAADDPGLAIFDMDSEAVTKLLEDGNIYLDLMNEDPDFEYSITSVPNEVKSVARFDDETLESMEDQLKEQYESADVKVREVDHLFNGQAVFFKLLVSGEQNGQQVQLERYYTVQNYHAIYLTLQYWGAEIPEKYRTLSQDILYSVQFDEPDDYTAAEASETEASEEAEAASGPIEQMLAKPETTQTEAEAPAPAPVQKSGFPVLPVILGLAVAAAAAGVLITLRIRRARRPAGDLPPARKDPAKRTCAVCGAPLSGSRRVCPYCGTKIE